MQATHIKSYLTRLLKGEWQAERAPGGKCGSGKPRWRGFSVVRVALLVYEQGRALRAALGAAVEAEEPAPSHHEQRLALEAEKAALVGALEAQRAQAAALEAERDLRRSMAATFL